MNKLSNTTENILGRSRNDAERKDSWVVPHRRGRFEYASPDEFTAIWGPPGVNPGVLGGVPGVLRGGPGGVPSVAYLIRPTVGMRDARRIELLRPGPSNLCGAP